MKKYITLRPLTFYALVLCASLSLLSVFNIVAQVFATENDKADQYEELKTLTDVIALVQKNYYKDVDFKQLVEGAVKGMMTTLDPHSSYMNADNYKELKVETKGEFGGLGIEITANKDGILTVITPIEDSPAARSGVRPGDQIIKIENEFTKDLSLNDAIKKMRGPKGSPVTISVHREGRKNLIPFTIVRDIIKVKSVRYRMLEDGYGYVRLAQFQEDSLAEFSRALDELGKQSKGGLKGLILDLRNNPGGLLTQAIRIADVFLEDGLVVYTDGRLESQKQKYFAHKDGTEPQYPLIVLVNEGSASASEIVAGALQDAGRAEILGEQTFGKGSVQTIIPMEKGDALRLTTALYFTRNGRSIQAQGITPEIKVASKKDDDEKLPEEKIENMFPKEKDLPRAIKNPNHKQDADADEPKLDENQEGKNKMIPIGSRAAIEADLQKLLESDAQLAEAFKRLKNWKDIHSKPPVQAQNSSTSAAPAM